MRGPQWRWQDAAEKSGRSNMLEVAQMICPGGCIAKIMQMLRAHSIEQHKLPDISISSGPHRSPSFGSNYRFLAPAL
jgi:hypothetical protein